jgi:serine/threonine protein kinase
MCIDDYNLGNILGRGAYGLVNLATEKATGKVVALKSVSMNQILEFGKMRHIIREKELLNSLDHSSIIQLITTFKVSLILSTSLIFHSFLPG